MRIAFPIYSRTQDRDELRALHQRATRLQAVTIFPLLGLLIVAAPVLVPVVFGPAWEGAVLPSQILAGAGMVAAILVGYPQVMLAVGKPKVLLRFNIGMLSAYIVASIVSAPYGTYGGLRNRRRRAPRHPGRRLRPAAATVRRRADAPACVRRRPRDGGVRGRAGGWIPAGDLAPERRCPQSGRARGARHGRRRRLPRHHPHLFPRRLGRHRAACRQARAVARPATVPETARRCDPRARLLAGSRPEPMCGIVGQARSDGRAVERGAAGAHVRGARAPRAGLARSVRGRRGWCSASSACGSSTSRRATSRSPTRTARSSSS